MVMMVHVEVVVVMVRIMVVLVVTPTGFPLLQGDQGRSEHGDWEVLGVRGPHNQVRSSSGSSKAQWWF